MVVDCLPIVVLGIFSLIQPGYTDQLFHDPTGQKILKFAIGSDLARLDNHQATTEGELLI